MTLQQADFWLTLAAVFGGAAWAAWTWRYAEKLRRQKEIPSPDGQLSVTCIPLGRDQLVVSLKATWRNRGVFPIELDASKSLASVFEINTTHDVGSLCCEQAVAEKNLFSGRFFLQPDTDSEMDHVFVVPAGSVYLVRAVIELDKEHACKFGESEPVVFYCKREAVVDGTGRQALKLCTSNENKRTKKVASSEELTCAQKTDSSEVRKSV